MLNIKQPIIADDIYDISTLSPGHPVYKLEGWGDGNSNKVDAIVIKLESGNARNVATATWMMNIVDQRSTQVVLSPQEIQQLKTWATSYDVPSTEAFKAANSLVSDLSQRGSWLKMELRQLITLDNAVANMGAGNKADVRVIAKALKNSGGLEKLGEIISADLFNGSNDRFAYPPILGQAGTQVVQNQGNVFIACNGNGSGVPIGLDNFDPFSTARHADGPQAQQMDLSLGQWGGNLLNSSNSQQRETFANCVIEDLEFLLGGGQRNRKTRFGSQNRLGTARKKRLLKGIDSGAKKMKKSFDHSRRQANGRNFSTGITRKLAVLNW